MFLLQVSSYIEDSLQLIDNYVQFFSSFQNAQKHIRQPSESIPSLNVWLFAVNYACRKNIATTRNVV